MRACVAFDVPFINRPVALAAGYYRLKVMARPVKWLYRLCSAKTFAAIFAGRAVLPCMCFRSFFVDGRRACCL